jgi:hypothetical protein
VVLLEGWFLLGGGDNLVLFTISLHFISGLIRGVAFGGSGLIRGGLLYLEINKKKNIDLKTNTFYIIFCDIHDWLLNHDL